MIDALLDLMLKIGVPLLIIVAFITFFIKVIISIFKGKKEKKGTVSITEETKAPKKEKIIDGKCPKCGNKLTESYTDSGICYNCTECHFKQKM